MTDLIDYLLARLDDEDAVARKAIEDADRAREDPSGSTLYVSQASSSGDLIVAVSPMRARDDAAARRQVVELVRSETALVPEGEAGYERTAHLSLGRRILRVLVQPYADREDFDLSWLL